MLNEITGINYSTLHKITKLLEKFSANLALSCLISSLLIIGSLSVSSTKAEAASCSSAMAKLQNAKRKLIPSQRQARKAERNLQGIRRDFTKAHNSRNRWKSKHKRGRCNRSGANQRTCAKAEKEMRFWNKQMRQLQREEHRAVSKVRKLRSGRLAASVNRAERVRKASCGPIPAPQAPRRTSQEAQAEQIRRAAQAAALGAAVGIAIGIIGASNSGGSNCRNNPLGANC